MRYVPFDRSLVGNKATLIYFLALVVAAIFFAQVTTPITSSRTATRSDACFMSQKFVTDRLKSPSTATFPDWTPENCEVSQRNRIWVVRSYVDAENSFGAMLRTHYSAEMIYYPATDSWTLTSLTLDD